MSCPGPRRLRAVAWAATALPAVAHCAWGDKARAAASSATGNPLEMLSIARAMRDVPWLYPAVEIVHIIGFAILVGAAVMFDLRVLGLSRRIPVRALARHLLPWSVAALLIVVPTGLLMFSAHAGDLLGNRAFQLKMALLLTAAMNAAIFHTGSFQSAAAWDTDATAPLGARISVALSLVLWFSIIACGRLLAYL